MRKISGLFGVLILSIGLASCGGGGDGSVSPPPPPPPPPPPTCPTGTFCMGSDKHYPEEAPIHRVTVDDFFIDRTLVTNRDFRKFVNATGYVTFAENKP